MKPAAFDYIAPNSLEAAVEAIAAANGDGKVLAGGQSLMPLLNFRMTCRTVIVDLMHIPGMSFIELRGKAVAIGAMTRHADLEFSDLVAGKLPVMAAAMRHIAHLAIRNKGTIGAACRTPIRLRNCRCWPSSTAPRSRCRVQTVDRHRIQAEIWTLNWLTWIVSFSPMFTPVIPRKMKLFLPMILSSIMIKVASQDPGKPWLKS